VVVDAVSRHVKDFALFGSVCQTSGEWYIWCDNSQSDGDSDGVLQLSVTTAQTFATHSSWMLIMMVWVMCVIILPDVEGVVSQTVNKNVD
jgi:hypothetical protein